MALESFKFSERYPMPPPEILKKLELSEQRYLREKVKKIGCPQCGQRLLDATEHRDAVTRVKCQGCKFEGPLDLRLFRTQEKSHRYIFPL